MKLTEVFALITGASRGLGKATAEVMLNAGARVCGTTRNTAFPESLQKHSRFEGIQVDQSHTRELEKGIKPLFNRRTAPNVLINNAGINISSGFDMEDASWLNHWDDTMQVNLRAPALMSKWALNRWQTEKGGILINVSSRAAYRGDTQQYSAYAASKGGLVAFTKSVARDFGKYGIAAYTIAPGFLKTDMAAEAVNTYGEDYLMQGIAFDEVTSPGEAAEMIAFLSSGKVKHMTGSTFHINGGSYMI